MPRTYMPTTDNGVLEWSENFANKIAENPEGYGLTAGQSAEYTADQAGYAAKYAAAINPETRGGATVLAKNNAKNALVSLSRSLAMAATNHPGVTDQQRYDLGLTVKDTEPTPIGPPEVMPVLRVASVQGRVLDIELRQEDGQSRRKPKGVRSAWLYSFVGEAPPTDLQQWRFHGGTTRSNPQVVFPEGTAPGVWVWVTALWVNPTSQPGPACAPVSARINYEGLSEAA